MVKGNQPPSSKLEWRVNIPDGTAKTLVPESGLGCRIWSLLLGVVMKIWGFIVKAWKLGVDEPKKVIHCFKVGMALTLVSLFYYMRPLYDGVGGSAMWAVMTVVVVFEYTVGATVSKSINRATGTFLAGSLGIGIHWMASRSGEKFEPTILGGSVFLLASAATFSRFIPLVKARFDYGAMIFILTFSLVSVSGYRVEKLLEMALQRLSTVGIACVEEYFKASDCDSGSETDKNSGGSKCVLNSKATEESMANFARWEPAHGSFNFLHPWKQYLKIGASMRGCAYCIETLEGCIYSEILAPEILKDQFRDVCVNLSKHSSNVLRELAVIMNTMTKSSKIDFSVGEMNYAVHELQNALKSPPSELSNTGEAAQEEQAVKTAAVAPPLLEVLSLSTLVSMLTEIAARIEGIAEAVEELATLAEFKPAADQKPKQKQTYNNSISDHQNHEAMKILQRV
ncbi:Aluminum-activated malate transporter [Dillenia turbinata]|uniref:Aluminum-activated malate transporter n=1 Tax=Dillenia turbinata TaxID=194707 RepID=A0AAN8Z1I1_9MAGN